MILFLLNNKKYKTSIFTVNSKIDKDFGFSLKADITQ